MTLICRITGKFSLEETSEKHLVHPLLKAWSTIRTDQIFRTLPPLVLKISKDGQQHNVSAQPFLIFDGPYDEKLFLISSLNLFFFFHAFFWRQDPVTDAKCKVAWKEFMECYSLDVMKMMQDEKQSTCLVASRFQSRKWEVRGGDVKAPY